MNTTLLIVAITGVINLLLAALILVRNPGSTVNRSFGFFAVSMVVWTVFNYQADFADSNNLLYTRLTFTAAVLLAFSIYYLSNVFPSGKIINRPTTLHFQVMLGVIIGALSMSPYLVSSVTKSPEGVELEVAAAYSLYPLYIFQLLAVIITNFLRSYKRADNTAKTQIKLLLAGIITYAVLAIGSNLILPLLVDSWSSSKFGPIFTLAFVGFTAYAIVKHKMLDIKLIVARSLGYLFSIFSFSVIYAIIGFFVLNKLMFKENPLSLEQGLSFIIFAVILTLTFPRVKNFFDRITDRVFFRDSYDPQAFLDQLNQVLISNIELSILLRRASVVIQENLKSSVVAFAILEIDGDIPRVVGTDDSLDPKAVGKLAGKLATLDNKLIVADGLSQDQAELRKLLKDSNVAAVAQLITPAENFKYTTGYVLLGPKKSGNPYSTQDLRIMEIVTDELVIAIQNAIRFSEIQNFNANLQDRINDATRKLRISNEKLQALDETKDEFISMASHQLRTPLTSVKGYLSMVIEGDAGPINEAQRKLLNQSFYSSQRMVYLIADLLNVSRLRTGKFVIDAAPVNLADIVEQELDQLKEIAATRQLKLNYKKPKSFPELMLDETKIRQLIMNFTDNALYYTPAGGKVDVELSETDHSVELRIIDNGIGVPRAEQKHLFTKFYRAGNARKARPDGTGLGLFMAKKVVVAQGGALIFESKEGKGSTFGFTFNKSKLAVPSESAEPKAKK